MTELTPSLSGIVAENSEIIHGMESIYGTLIEMGYVQNTDVQVPPHGLPKEPIAVAPLRAAGLLPKTIEIIGRLPCFTNEIIERQRESAVSRDGIAIAPFSSAASYLLGSGRHDEAREVGLGGQESDGSLPATAFKLATTSSSEGYNLAYDLTDKTILQWHPAGWAKCQRIPVSDFMADWIHKLRSLEWLPWVDDHGWEIEERQANRERELADSNSALWQEIKAKLEDQRKESQSQGLDPRPIEEMFVRYDIILKASQNRYWSKRRLYEECGWPDAFDRGDFEKRREVRNARAKALGASAASKITAPAEDIEDNEQLREFYKAGAGQHAV